MDKRGTFTKFLAVVGTALLWLPIFAPLFFGLAAFILDGTFRFDFLMPAELFLLVLAGGGLLLWAALWARSRLALTGWGLSIAILALIGGQLLAEITGLASGEIATSGWPMVLVSALIALYTAAVIVTGAGGLLLLRDLFKVDISHSKGV